MKVKGFQDRVNQLLVKSVMILIGSNVLQVCPKHLEDDLHIAPEQEGVFCHKEIATLFTQPWYLNTPAAGTDLAVLDDQALVTGRGELVLDQIGESRFQVEDRAAFIHHALDGVTALCLFLLG